MVLLVAYDLHNPGRDYAAIEKVLQTADFWYHIQGSVWLLDTLIAPETWRDHLMAAGDANDTYLVTRLEGSWASYQATAINTWLNSPSRRW